MLGTTVAFQGVHGAYSEQALRQHFGESVDVLPCTDFNELFETLQTGKTEYAILPVENSVAGSVNGAYELLLDYDLRIQADVVLHVRHQLLAPIGTRLEDIKQVRSHPQALAQCDRYIKRHKLQPIVWYDTAGSAHDLAKECPPHTAAIASRLAASLYGLEIIEPDIEDMPFNYTRFFILSNEDPAPSTYNKTSIVFAVRNRPAALYECLGEFAERGLNITKLESRPRRNRPWEPVFYLDFEGFWQEPACQEALMKLLQKASFVKMLGSYPATNTTTVGM
jgi:prephenate dehydratase